MLGEFDFGRRSEIGNWSARIANMDSVPALFTIGHSNHTDEQFVQLLRQHGIDVLADVRSQPYSKYTNQFNREDLQALLARHRLKYVFMGQSLGGRPEGEVYYDNEGHVLYHRVAEADFFLQGLERIQKGIASYRVAMMCSEEDPLVCHRHRLVARVLRSRGVPIQHIRGDGRVESYEQVEPPAKQKMLFDELEVDSWRSLLSVLPKPQPETFLES